MSASQAAWAPDVDLYADLELHQTATQEDIKKSYKRLALKYHPDKQKIGQAVDTAPFRKVQEAYDILSNEDSRRRYDARGSYQNRNIFRRRQEEKEEEDWIRRRRENIRANAKALASMKAMDKLLKKAEKEAKEHARNTRHLQAERRSQAAIRRRQKEADHMARLRLQQQNEAEQRHEHTAQDQTQSEAHEPPPHQPRAQQHAASVRAPVSPPREKTTMNGGSQGSGGDDDIRRLSPCEGAILLMKNMGSFLGYRMEMEVEVEQLGLNKGEIFDPYSKEHLAATESSR
ncbi:hypothetical protein N0V82_003285 [Gnomoniopsis sp. IMI 355080]|nr:hypothetical protein N0V82_003285 [Gnomoniopsis sp. IMI 355080]